MAKEVSPGVKALRKVVDDVHADARRAHAEGKLVGWSSSKFPCELAEAFDLNVMYPENQAAGIAANRDGEIMCKAAEDLGFDNDICGYARISLAYAAGKRASRKVDLETGEYVINPNSGKPLKDENGNVIKQGFDYYLKPMNCPMHNLIFKSRQRSYRELPLRLFEFGTVYRYEKSGEVHGLTRVRGLTQDDSHIYCTREQMKDELKSLLTFVLGLLKDFGLDDFYLELSTKDPHKYVGSDEIWEEATNTLAEVAKESGLDLVDDPCGAAFYGPKISVQARDAIGRTWQVSTIQLDFNLPERFKLEYIAADGTHQRPVMIHRALFGSIERFFAVLLEHYAGAFPAWLAPVQVLGVPVADEFAPHLQKFIASLEEETVRCEIDLSDDRFGKKIRNASKSKVPFILIVGEEDMNNNAVSFRFRDGSQLNGVPVDEAREKILAVIKKRAQVNSADDFAAALA